MSGALCVLLSGGPNPVSVVASPATVSGGIVGSTGYTDPTTATISGGVAPYTGFWDRISGSSLMLPESPNAFTTRFGSEAIPPGESISGFFVFRVTDAVGTTATSNSVQAVLTR